jgi:hypothetical protein
VVRAAHHRGGEGVGRAPARDSHAGRAV